MSSSSDDTAKFEAELLQIQHLIERLRNDSGAEAVVLVGKDGQLVASSVDQKTLTTTDGPPAERFGESQAPKDIRVVGGRAVLIAQFPMDSTLVPSSQTARSLSEALKPVLDELDRSVRLAALGQLLPDLTEKDLHDLLAT